MRRVGPLALVAIARMRVLARQPLGERMRRLAVLRPAPVALPTMPRRPVEAGEPHIRALIPRPRASRRCAVLASSAELPCHLPTPTVIGNQDQEPEPLSNTVSDTQEKAPRCGAFPVRPRGLEPPRTIQSTRPSTLTEPCRCFETRGDRANRELPCTNWPRWKGWMLSRLLSRRLRISPSLRTQSTRSAASEPLAEERVEHERSILVVAPDVALVGEEALECVLECAASDSVFVCHPAAGWRLAVGER